MPARMSAVGKQTEAPTRDENRYAPDHQESEAGLGINVDAFLLISRGKALIQEGSHDPRASQQEECIPHDSSTRHGQGRHKGHGASDHQRGGP